MVRIKKRKNVAVSIIAIIILVILAVVLITGTGNKPYCSNGNCEDEETCLSCPQDCGSCPTTTTIKITTTIPPTTTIISKCYSNSDCMWCGENCIVKRNDIECIAIAPPEGYTCECVNGVCTKVKISTTTTVKIPDSCNETDGGLKWDVQGTISGYFLGKPYNYTDFCTSDTLTEYYCLGTHYWHMDYNCEYASKKCVDGACV